MLPNVLKRGGGSSNVHVVLKGGSSKCSCPFTRGRGGVKIVPNPVHVVCERPLIPNSSLFNLNAKKPF